MALQTLNMRVDLQDVLSCSRTLRLVVLWGLLDQGLRLSLMPVTFLTAIPFFSISLGLGQHCLHESGQKVLNCISLFHLLRP